MSFDSLVYYENGSLDPKNLLKANDIGDFLKKSFEQSFTTINISLNEDQNLSNNGSKLFIGNYNFSTNNDPTMFLAILNQVYGLCIEQASYDYNTSTWKIEGVFWEKENEAINSNIFYFFSVRSLAADEVLANHLSPLPKINASGYEAQLKKNFRSPREKTSS
uniref:Uncharacterized protein n=1 Tax=Escherichia coli TaxID=562 RepID=A0A6M9X787_ECOLX|nr:hypothetical protein [Escherichia coli]QKN61154.1 hypothetical protein HHJ25_23455 [Escherichia coli]